MKRKYVEFKQPDASEFNVGPDENWIVWEIKWKRPQLNHFQSYFGKVKNSKNLFKVVAQFGAKSILTIGGLSGELIEPGKFLELNYPGGEPMEKAWQFLWEPTELTRQLINAEIKAYQQNHEQFIESANSIFKTSVLLKATDYGQSEVEVSQILLRRLPRMLKKGPVWRLEKTLHNDLQVHEEQYYQEPTSNESNLPRLTKTLT